MLSLLVLGGLLAAPTLAQDASIDLVPEETRRAARQAFDDVSLSDIDVSGLSREAEDEALKSALKAKTSAYLAFVGTIKAQLEGASPAEAADLYGELGSMYEAMAEAIDTMVTPSYLTEPQRGAFRQSLRERANPLRAQAASAYGRAATFASDAGETGQATEFSDRAAQLTPPPPVQGLIGMRSPTAKRDALVARIESCDLKSRHRRRLDAAMEAAGQDLPSTFEGIVAQGKAYDVIEAEVDERCPEPDAE